MATGLHTTLHFHLYTINRDIHVKSSSRVQIPVFRSVHSLAASGINQNPAKTPVKKLSWQLQILNSKMPKSPKAFYARTSSNNRRSTIFITVSVILGLSALFGLYAMMPARSSRCGDFKPLSVSVTWDKSSSASSSGGATADKGQNRHKAMGFVGVQTGFASAGRRRSLRKTWFPSDHKGLKRYSLCFHSNFVFDLHFCCLVFTSVDT